MKKRVSIAIGVVAALAPAAAIVWVALLDTPQASAQEVVEGACNQMNGVDSFDLYSVKKASLDGVPWEGTLVQKARISGADYHSQYTVEATGDTDEIIRVGGKGYYRSNDNAWQVSDGPLQDTTSHLAALGVTPICPDLSKVTWKGEEELNGVKVDRYISGSAMAEEVAALNDVDSAFRGEKRIAVHDYWVDERGQLVKHRLEAHTLAQYDYGRGISVVTAETTFSGVEEPNIITAPVVGSP